MGGRWSVDKDVESVKNHPENVRYFWLCGNDDRWDTGEWHQPKGDSLWLASLSMLFQIPPIISSPKSQFLQIKLLLPFSLQWRLAMSHKWYEKHKRFRSAKLSWVCRSSNCCQDPDGRTDVTGRFGMRNWKCGIELNRRFFTILPVIEKGITEKTISWGIPGFNDVQAHNPMSNWPPLVSFLVTNQWKIFSEALKKKYETELSLLWSHGQRYAIYPIFKDFRTLNLLPVPPKICTDSHAFRQTHYFSGGDQ